MRETAIYLLPMSQDRQILSQALTRVKACKERARLTSRLIKPIITPMKLTLALRWPIKDCYLNLPSSNFLQFLSLIQPQHLKVSNKQIRSSLIIINVSVQQLASLLMRTILLLLTQTSSITSCIYLME